MESLKKKLQDIDGKGYKAYKNIKGKYSFPAFTLVIDHVQADPFASPSKIRCLIPIEKTSIKKEWHQNRYRKIGLEDWLARHVSKAIKTYAGSKSGTGNSGIIAIDEPGQEVLERMAVQIDPPLLTVCLSVGLPASGRRILARQAIDQLYHDLPNIMNRSVFHLDNESIEDMIHLRDQQEVIRKYMKDHHYIAFVANGSILPRESGISNKPLKSGMVVPFKSPVSMEIAIPVPHRKEPIVGMGIRQGITLIVGGGYHGKSTLLKAIERGVYDHIKGDGREFVLTDASAVKIRAEDGRKITNVNISPFITNLPYGKETTSFTTENASGSTSQAANIIEAIEAGAGVLLIDEDTSATNFMIRDRKMQCLIAKEKEPITPFIDKVRQLFEERKCSTILVMGGSGDYFHVADAVIQMDEYQAKDVTKEAKAIAAETEDTRRKEGGEAFGSLSDRVPLPSSLNSRKGKKAKVSAKGLHHIVYGSTDLSLDDVEQLVDASQTRAIAEILFFLERTNQFGKKLTMKELLDLIEQQIDEKGLGSLTMFPDQHPGELARPRRFEIAAALNRIRTLKIHLRK